MSEVQIGRVSTFADPSRRVIEIGGFEIGVFRLDSEFYAYENRCPHLAGPACQGKLLPRVLEDVGEDRKSAGRAFSAKQMHVICPWHGFEFDIRTGAHAAIPRYRLRGVAVRTDGSHVFVTLPERHQST